MSGSSPVTINSRKSDGTIRRSWQAELLRRELNELVFVGVFDFDVQHADLGLINRGTVSYEYYWLDRWYNIFAFHEADGTFRNYYCNISVPPLYQGDVLDYVDLDIDIVVWPDWSYAVLDEDEYARNAEGFGYDEFVRSRVTETLGQLQSMINARSLPVDHGPVRD
jgi:protein associated with RNAse G/E